MTAYTAVIRCSKIHSHRFHVCSIAPNGYKNGYIFKKMRQTIFLLPKKFLRVAAVCLHLFFSAGNSFKQKDFCEIPPFSIASAPKSCGSAFLLTGGKHHTGLRHERQRSEAHILPSYYIYVSHPDAHAFCAEVSSCFPAPTGGELRLKFRRKMPVTQRLKKFIDLAQ